MHGRKHEMNKILHSYPEITNIQPTILLKFNNFFYYEKG